MKKKTDIDDRTCTRVSNEYFFLRFQVIWEEKTLHRSNFDVFIKLPRHTLMVIYMHVFQVHYKRTTSFYFNCHFHNETLQANLDSVNQLFFAITLFRDLPKKNWLKAIFSRFKCRLSEKYNSKDIWGWFAARNIRRGKRGSCENISHVRE